MCHTEPQRGTWKQSEKPEAVEGRLCNIEKATAYGSYGRVSLICLNNSASWQVN